MRVKTKVSILGWGTALLFLFVMLNLILAQANRGVFPSVRSDVFARMFLGSLAGFAGIVSVMIWEFKIPKEKYSLKGEAKDVKTHTSGPARATTFNIENSVVAFAAPTPLFNLPDISDAEIEVHGCRLKTNKLPDFIFWNIDKYLKSIGDEIFFATRIKNLSTGEEHEAPLFVPALQIVSWIIIIVAPFVIFPSSIFYSVREVIHIPPTWFMIPVFGVIGLILAIILPNWIIERRKSTKSY